MIENTPVLEFPLLKKKTRRSWDRAILIMGIPISGKTVFILKRAPGRRHWGAISAWDLRARDANARDAADGDWHQWIPHNTPPGEQKPKWHVFTVIVARVESVHSKHFNATGFEKYGRAFLIEINTVDFHCMCQVQRDSFNLLKRKQ